MKDKNTKYIYIYIYYIRTISIDDSGHEDAKKHRKDCKVVRDCAKFSEAEKA